jgi:hypothetical protein
MSATNSERELDSKFCSEEWSLTLIDPSARFGDALAVSGVLGYRVTSSDGRSVGRVAVESEGSLVVESGLWPFKSWRALPKRHTLVRQDESGVSIQVSKHYFGMSPKLRRHAPINDESVESWWGI